MIWMPKYQINYFIDVIYEKLKHQYGYLNSGCSKHMREEYHIFQSLTVKHEGTV